MKTYTPREGEIKRSWWVVDANGMALGRLASQVAQILKGKHKPMYTPHLDVGDHVVIVNAGQVRLTGRKMEQETYFRHSNYPGGARFIKVAEVFAHKPAEVVRRAVKGMLPRHRLGRAMMKKLKIYPGAQHPHAPQKPEPKTLEYR